MSLGSGALAGLLVGCANKFGNMNRRSDYRDLKFFAYGYGLYDAPAYTERENNTIDYKQKMTQSQLNR